MAEQTRNRLGLVVTVLVLTFVHFALGPLFDSWYFSPNLLICAVLVSARQSRPGVAASVGFGLGLLEDAMAVSHFGLATLLFALIAYIGSLTRDLFVGEERLFIGTYLLVGTWVYEVLAFLLMGAGGDSLHFIFTQAPLDAFATAVVGYLVLPLVRTG